MKTKKRKCTLDPRKPRIHVYPMKDSKEHEMSINCWCSPSLNFSAEKAAVWLHNRIQ